MDLPEPVALFDLPLAEARALVRKGLPVYVPVNPVEAHGPHLSLHNDQLVSRALGRCLHEALEVDGPALFCADLGVGVEPCAGPGTVHTPYPMVRDRVLAACEALAHLGAEKVVFLTFHGAPLHSRALLHGARWLREKDIAAVTPFAWFLAEAMDFDPTHYPRAFDSVVDPVDREAVERLLPVDFHAGFFETSLAMALCPRSVGDHRAVPPCPAYEAPAHVKALGRALGARARKELDYVGAALGWMSLRPFPGYTSRPAAATPEAGRFFTEQVVSRMLRGARAVFERGEENPDPLAWLLALNLEGRLPSPTIPPRAWGLGSARPG